MRAMLSIGEAARRLNLSVDTVRELERTGQLRASRTPGGHRRFTAATLNAYLAREQRSTESLDDEYRESAVEDDWGEADAPDALVARPARAAHPATQPPTVESFARVADAYVERARLDRLRAHGRSRIPLSATARARSAAIEALESYVTAARFPASTPWWEAHPAIEAKVAAVLEPFSAEEVRQPSRSVAATTPRKDRAPDDRGVQALIADGKSRALFATLGWERDDAAEARAEVLEALEEEVEPDWAERDVNELVDEILGEWEEESEE